MPKSDGAQPTYTAKDTGVNTETNQIVFWDPVAQTYKTAPYSWDSWKAGDKNKYSWYVNSQGDHVYGLKPPTTHTVVMGGESIKMEGSDPNWKPQVQPDYNGMGDDGGTRTPTNTAGTGVNWGGSGTHDINGNVVPGGPADPSVYGPGGSQYWKPGDPVNTSWDWGQAPGQGGGTGGPDMTGYSLNYGPGRDSPWGMPNRPGNNKDFYAKQFNNLLLEQQNAKSAEIAAAIRQNYAQTHPQAAPAMDWSWANNGRGLPQVGSAGGTIDNPTKWTLADWVVPGVTTNQQLVTRAFQDGAIDQGQYAALGGANMIDGGNAYWSTATNPNWIASQAGPDISPGFLDKLAPVFNNIFTQTGIETPPGGGPTAAPGYALPVGVR